MKELNVDQMLLVEGGGEPSERCVYANIVAWTVFGASLFVPGMIGVGVAAVSAYMKACDHSLW